MKRTLARWIVLGSVLASSLPALAQDGDTTPAFSLTNLAGIIAPIAALIWFILFVRWGGLRWLF